MRRSTFAALAGASCFALSSAAYLNPAALHQMKADVARFYDEAK